MRKIYILTCVNENSEVVSVQTYKSEREAKADMEAQYEAEKKEAESAGFEIDDYFSGVEGKTAGILYGETQYRWQVHEAFDPVAEDECMDAMKRDFIEQVYFTAKASFEDDENQILDEPVEDYTMFYLDDGNEDLKVWNEKERNWTSIFSLGVDDAYEIAKRIELGEYTQEESEECE